MQSLAAMQDMPEHAQRHGGHPRSFHQFITSSKATKQHYLNYKYTAAHMIHFAQNDFNTVRPVRASDAGAIRFQVLKRTN